VGPGRYEVGSTTLKLLKRSPCQVKYKPLVVGNELSGSGTLHYEGDRLVFEPNFTDPRKSQPFLKLRKLEDTLGGTLSFGRLPTQQAYFMRTSTNFAKPLPGLEKFPLRIASPPSDFPIAVQNSQS
jgi:hypothetical protein